MNAIFVLGIVVIVFVMMAFAAIIAVLMVVASREDKYLQKEAEKWQKAEAKSDAQKNLTRDEVIRRSMDQLSKGA